MAKPLYVAVSTQKGGAGKTTLTAVLASYLCYLRMVNVAVIDCDYPQWSFSQLRERDLKLLEKSDKVRKSVSEMSKNRGICAYSVHKSTPEHAVECAAQIAEHDSDVKVIFFDLPGTVNNVHVINLIKQMDYVFCPMTTDPMVFETSLSYANLVKNEFVSTGDGIKALYLVWNRVTSRERSKLQMLLETFVSKLGLPVLETALPDSSRFRKEGQCGSRLSVFRSTILPPDKSLRRGSGIDELVAEISGIIGI